MYPVSLTVESWTPFGSCVTAAFTFRLTPHNSTYEKKDTTGLTQLFNACQRLPITVCFYSFYIFLLQSHLSARIRLLINKWDYLSLCYFKKRENNSFTPTDVFKKIISIRNKSQIYIFHELSGNVVSFQS